MREVNARTFRNLVTIQSDSSTTRDTNGDYTQGWADVSNGDRYASIEGLNGRELLQAKSIEADVTHRIRMRSDSLTSTISPKQRIKFVDQLQSKTRYFNIVSVYDIESKNRVMELMCKEQL